MVAPPALGDCHNSLRRRQGHRCRGLSPNCWLLELLASRETARGESLTGFGNPVDVLEVSFYYIYRVQSGH
jgi:hypothetical protein